MNKTSREYYIREAIKSELVDGNAPRIESLHRALTAYKGKMFKVDGQPTQAFKAVLEPLQLSTPSSGYYAEGGYKTVIQSLQVRSDYSSLELHIRATSTIEGEHGTQYTDHIIYLGKFSYADYTYNQNETDLKSIYDIIEAIHLYNPYELEDIQQKQTARTKLLEQVKELENNMPYYSYR